MDANGNTVIGGYTSSTNLPLTNAFQSSVAANQGGIYGNYGFVTRVQSERFRSGVFDVYRWQRKHAYELQHRFMLARAVQHD